MGRGGHALLRWYATFHLAAVYAAHVDALGGVPSPLRPPAAWEGALRALGLWRPPVLGGLLPPLGLLLLATLHAGVRAAVAASARAHLCGSVDGVETWHPAAVVYASRAAVAYGPAAIVALVRASCCCCRSCCCWGSPG